VISRTAVLLSLAIIPTWAVCQVRTIDLYQYNYASISPAFAGTDGTKITAMGNIFVPGYGNGFYNVFAGFETKVKDFGIGFTGSRIDDGWYSMQYVSTPVNYQWKLDDKRKLIFGARLSFEQVRIGYQVPNANQAVEDMAIDGWIYRSGFNSGLALLYKEDKFYAGFSVDNVVHSKLYSIPEITARQYNLIVGKNFHIDELLSSEHSVYAAIIRQLDWRIDLNNSLIIGKSAILGVSVMINYEVYTKVNAGWRFGKLGQAVVSLYSASNAYPDKKFSGQLMLQFNLAKLTSPS